MRRNLRVVLHWRESESRMFLFSAVQQAPVCTHRPDEPVVQRPAAGVRGHPTDLRQVPWEERRPEGAVWERATERLLLSQVLGESFLSSVHVRAADVTAGLQLPHFCYCLTQHDHHQGLKIISSQGQTSYATKPNATHFIQARRVLNQNNE